MRVQVIHPGDLMPDQKAAWRRITDKAPAVAGPYFSLGFATAVGKARQDARIAVLETASGVPQAFLGVQGKGRFARMALGAPLSDFQGPVSAIPLSDVDPALFCRALGAGRIDFTHVPESHAGFLSAFEPGGFTWIADLREGKSAYLGRIRQRRAETLRQQDRKRRKLERERPGVAFHAAAKDPSHLRMLLDWKTDQCRRTRQPLVWAAPWVREVVEASFYSEDPGFCGLLFTMTDEDRLVAAHYALVAGRTMHAWLIAHDHAYDVHSPGVLLTRFMVEWAADNGMAEIDFGAGDYRYKREFCEAGQSVGWGYVGHGSVAAVLRRVEIAGRKLMEQAPIAALAAAPGKARRRLDVMRGLAIPG